MQRFRFDDLAKMKPGDPVDLDRAESSHLFKILRARPGDRVELLDGHGTRGCAEVGTGRLLRLIQLAHEEFPARRIHLFIAPPRRQKMDQILRETTELGVYRIVPVICARSLALPDSDSAERQTGLLFEACKQSGNAYLPILGAPVSFAEAVETARRDCGLTVFGSPYENGLPGVLPDDTGFFVGPEGGFSEEEERLMNDAGFRPMRIGPWILRVETAAAAGIARLWK